MYAWLMLAVFMGSPSPTAGDPHGPECRSAADASAADHQEQVRVAIEERGCLAPVVRMQFAEYLARDCLVKGLAVGCRAQKELEKAGRVDADFLTHDAAARICGFEEVWLRRPTEVAEEDAACAAKTRLEPMTFPGKEAAPKDLRAPAKKVYDSLSGICWRRTLRQLEATEASLQARFESVDASHFEAVRADAVGARDECEDYEDRRSRVEGDARASWEDASALCKRLAALARKRPSPAPSPTLQVGSTAPKATPTPEPPKHWSSLLPPTRPPIPPPTQRPVVDRTPRALGIAAGGFALVGGALFAAGVGEDNAVVEVGVPLMLLSAGILGAVALIMESDEPTPTPTCPRHAHPEPPR